MTTFGNEVVTILYLLIYVDEWQCRIFPIYHITFTTIQQCTHHITISIYAATVSSTPPHTGQRCPQELSSPSACCV